MKKVGVLFAIFLALAAFVYFYEIAGETEREEIRSLEESLLRMKREDITGLEILRPEAEGILLSKEAQQWVIKHPVETSADGSTVDVLLRDLSQATRDRTFPEGGARAEKYGLHEPRMRLKVQAGGEDKTLLIGNDDFTGSNIYAQFQGDSEVLLTSRVLFSTADKDLMQWRSKKVLVFDRDELQEIEVVNSADTIRLTRPEEDWRLEAPIQELADQNAVSSLLSTVEFAQAQEFVSDDPEDLKSYGLDPPRATLRVRHRDQDDGRQLELAQQEADHYLARHPDRPSVFTVNHDEFEKVNQDLWAYRDKEVMDVDQDQIARVVIRREEGEEIALRYEDYQWIVESPESQKDKEALSYKFWYPINDIRFESIEDEESSERNFPEPDVQLTVTLTDGSKRTFDFASQDDRYLERKVDSGRQGTISQEDFEKLHFKLEDIF